MEKTMFHFMKKMVMSAVMFGIVFAQNPIIRVKQLGDWDSPQTWWKDSVTQDLDDFLAQVRIRSHLPRRLIREKIDRCRIVEPFAPGLHQGEQGDDRGGQPQPRQSC